MSEPVDLEELIDLIRRAWPEHYARGRILHVHRNGVPVKSGALVHLRVMVQQIADGDPAYHQEGDTNADKAEGRRII